MSKRQMIAAMAKIGLSFRGWIDGELMFESFFDEPLLMFGDWWQVEEFIGRRAAK